MLNRKFYDIISIILIVIIIGSFFMAWSGVGSSFNEVFSENISPQNILTKFQLTLLPMEILAGVYYIFR